MKVIAAIQARMGSERLPGKAMADICGQPLLSAVLWRVRRAELVDDIVLATTELPEDDILMEWAAWEGICCWRGSEDDVLDRIVGATMESRGGREDVLVQVWGDTPLLDPQWIDVGVRLVECGFDLVMDGPEAIFPNGLATHVCRLENIYDLSLSTTDEAHREHVTLGLQELGECKIYQLKGLPGMELPGQRLQVDYPEDLEVVRAIYDHGGAEWDTREIVKFLKANPSIANLNAHCKDKPVR